MFFFLSLALLKRFSEIDATVHEGGGPESMRGYRPADRHPVAQFGVASGCISSLVMALYTNSRDVAALFSNPAWLRGFCPFLLRWISRIWHAAYHGDMHDDPIIFFGQARLELRLHRGPGGHSCTWQSEPAKDGVTARVRASGH